MSENKEKNILGSCARQNEYSNQQYSYLRSKKASYDREIPSLSQKEEAKFEYILRQFDFKWKFFIVIIAKNFSFLNDQN